MANKPALHVIATFNILCNIFNLILRFINIKRKRANYLEATRRQQRQAILREKVFLFNFRGRYRRRALLLNRCCRRTRSVWEIERKTDIWDDVMTNWTPKDFHQNLRMSRQTFLHVCDTIRPLVTKKPTRFRPAIPVEKRVMLTLWKLATGIEFRSLSVLFGVGRSTAFNIFHDVVHAINERLGPKYLVFPTGENLRRVINGYRRRWGFPQCVGAIDGTHIPIISPKEHQSDYVNRKRFHSIILQAVCDDNYTFTNINVGQPGKHHDAFVLQSSPIYEQAMNGTILPSWSENINGVDVPLFLIGDPAYPLNSWLMKGYPGGGSTNEQKLFNYRLSRARMTIECAFGRLKGRWRCLRKTLDLDVHNVPSVVSACCILHNVCETHGDYFDNDWSEDSILMNSNSSSASGAQDNASAKAVRDALCGWMCANPL